MNRQRIIFKILPVLLALGLLGGCDVSDMNDQPRFEPLEASDFFADGMSARPPVEGTVAQGHLILDDAWRTGRSNGQLVNMFPFPITRRDLEIGRERYDIYCAVCHGATGAGDGMIVQRGFTPPPSLHLDRLRDPEQSGSVGHFYEVMTNGFGAMYSYNDRISVDDRWRIAAYIRALQVSQAVPAGALPQEDQQSLREAPAAQEGVQ